MVISWLKLYSNGHIKVNEKSAIGPGANVHSGVAIIARTYNSGRLFSFQHATQMFETGAHVLGFATGTGWNSRLLAVQLNSTT